MATTPAEIFAGDVEILRGDLGRILFEATKDGTEYLFGDSVTGLDEHDDGVHVTFARAAPRFDLVIGADGLHSTVRQLAFAGQPDPVRHLGLYVAIFSVPDKYGLDHEGLLYSTPGKTAAVFSTPRTGKNVTGSSAPPRTGSPSSSTICDAAQQQQILASVFAGVGWHVPDLLAQMPAADDFLLRLGEPGAARPLVSLAGSPSPATPATPPVPGGNGTGTAVVAAYVLAGSWPRPAVTTASPTTATNGCSAPTWPAARSKPAGAPTSSPRPPKKKIAQRDRFFRLLPDLPPARALVKHLSTRTATAIKLPEYSAFPLASGRP